MKIINPIIYEPNLCMIQIFSQHILKSTKDLSFNIKIYVFYQNFTLKNERDNYLRLNGFRIKIKVETTFSAYSSSLSKLQKKINI